MPEWKTATQLARLNRRNQTKEENILWQRLRNRKCSGKKFLRQYVIKYLSPGKHTPFFIADFYCHELRLVIEVDGKYHEWQKTYDEMRDQIILELGITVKHIKNEELNDLAKVMRKIKGWVDSPPIPLSDTNV